MADQSEQVIQFISQNGPVLPVQIAKRLETEILFASAILSDLTSRKRLKITRKPIGGSPLYYLPGQEALLETRLYPILKQKEKEAYDLLKEKKIIWEKDLEPWQRIAFGDLKDFAVQLQVSLDANNIIKFWKFYLTSDVEANEQIKSLLENIKPLMQPSVEEQKPIQEPPPRIEPKKEEISTEMMDRLRKEIISEVQANIKSQPKPQVIREEQIKEKVELAGKLYSKIESFFLEKHIEIISKELIKKDKEFDFIAAVPSNVGNLKYYIKAKDKPKINESDLSLALSEGHSKKLPTLVLAPAELTKKAQDLIKKHQGMLTFKKI